MNYYNEFDPKAAAWLRELIKALNRFHPVNSSFYPKAHGTLDTTPKPFAATCNYFWLSTDHSVPALAYGQHLKLSSLRKLRRFSVRLGSTCKNGQGFPPGTSFGGFVHGKQIAALDESCGTQLSTSACFRVCTQWSKAICCFVQGLYQNAFRTSCNCAQLTPADLGAFADTCLYTLLNSISGGCASLASRPRIQHTLALQS